MDLFQIRQLRAGRGIPSVGFEVGATSRKGLLSARHLPLCGPGHSWDGPVTAQKDRGWHLESKRRTLAVETRPTEDGDRLSPRYFRDCHDTAGDTRTLQIGEKVRCFPANSPRTHP
jgi:hypothetical protein